LAGDPVTVILAVAPPIELVIDRAFRIEFHESLMAVLVMSMIEVVFFGLLWSNNVAGIDTDDFVPGNKIAAGAKWWR
jgi:hypothetical protein